MATVLLFFSTFLSGACFAQQDDTKEIRVLGVGVVQGEETNAARDQAVSNALASAVERALEDTIPSDVIVRNFKTLDNNLFGNAGDYIRDYKVLIENRKEATLRIYLQASVLSEKIRARLSELGVVLAETDLPKVLFVIAEQNIADLLPIYWWGEDPSFVMPKSEEAMAAVFQEKGYSVVDHGATLSMGMENLQEASAEEDEAQATAEETQEQDSAEPTVEQNLEPIIFNNPYLSNQEAAQLAYRLQADLVIVGTAAAGIVPNTMGATIRSFKAEVSLRAVDTNSRQQIASVDQESVEVSEDEIAGGNSALVAAGRLAGDKLASQIALTWKKAATSLRQGRNPDQGHQRPRQLRDTAQGPPGRPRRLGPSHRADEGGPGHPVRGLRPRLPRPRRIAHEKVLRKFRRRYLRTGKQPPEAGDRTGKAFAEPSGIDCWVFQGS